MQSPDRSLRSVTQLCVIGVVRSSRGFVWGGVELIVSCLTKSFASNTTNEKRRPTTSLFSTSSDGVYCWYLWPGFIWTWFDTSLVIGVNHPVHLSPPHLLSCRLCSFLRLEPLFQAGSHSVPPSLRKIRLVWTLGKKKKKLADPVWWEQSLCCQLALHKCPDCLVCVFSELSNLNIGASLITYPAVRAG